MIFRYQDVSIEWNEDQGYRHPASGEWVTRPRDCLRGWIEDDPARRRQWVELVARIEEFWPRVEQNRLELGEEVVFD